MITPFNVESYSYWRSPKASSLTTSAILDVMTLLLIEDVNRTSMAADSPMFLKTRVCGAVPALKPLVFLKRGRRLTWGQA
jgi:hypothetical protein